MQDHVAILGLVDAQEVDQQQGKVKVMREWGGIVINVQGVDQCKEKAHVK